MKTALKQKKTVNGTAESKQPAAGPGRTSAYGQKATICMNTACTLRKKAGGCFGFEGCPGFQAG